MSDAADVSFTTRGYIQGEDALTDLRISSGSYTLIMRGDVMDPGMPGAGVFVGTLTNSESAGLEDVLRESKKYPGFTPAPLIDKYVRAFYAKGEKLAKLDASINLSTGDGRLIVDVTLKNSGRERICLKSPSTWEGHYNPMSGSSFVRISAIRKGTNGKGLGQSFRTREFGGSNMIPMSNDPGAEICIPSMQEHAVRFWAFPDGEIKSGTYSVGASFVIRDVLEPKELSDGLEFFAINKEIVIPRDYPSTPEETRAFAAYLKTHAQE
ncbi:hypothetical protein [Paraburkholderia sp. J94]|uniref:hypothetical protein n=1 Tax=Paraburkholderia sp. J94 TaxID=2805441 RepID=UPI002AB196F0|nr:hypothetical protein [Paraburkholderia sp. J94]